MRGVAIVSPVRTAVGNFGGALRGVPAADLGAIVIKEVLSRSGVDPARVDDVILGLGYPSGENPAIGRLCGLKADLPIEVPGYQLDRRCSSGLQAILNAAMEVMTETADVVIPPLRTAPRPTRMSSVSSTRRFARLRGKSPNSVTTRPSRP